jgi:hypothetical protein
MGRPAAAWEPLGFFSRKLDTTQVLYSAYKRELLVCIQGIGHFCFMLEGRGFTLYPDHKPLTYALSKGVEPWTPRQCHQLSYVVEFTGDIGASPVRTMWWRTPCHAHLGQQRLSPPWRPQLQPPCRRLTMLPSPKLGATAHPSKQQGTPASPSSASLSALCEWYVIQTAATHGQ